MFDEKGLIVAVIPARGNSKGIPRKNMRELGGLPLIGYTLAAAFTAEKIDLVVVTTEDNEIANYVEKMAIHMGVFDKLIIIDRPQYLSFDFVQNDEVILHALRVLQLQGYDANTIVTLQPTSPFRDSVDIDAAVAMYAERWMGNPTVISGVRVQGKYLYSIGRTEGTMSPVDHDPEKRMGRQWENGRDYFVENGAIYVTNAEALSLKRTIRPEPILIYPMEQSKSLDLDTMEDWFLAEKIVESGYDRVAKAALKDGVAFDVSQS